ncbi:MAG: gliding motility-associated C-terminal domain-containing protein [Candidatus Latescibacteria bacterium]|nr:gliding motility-associated C-terminal domain-containing protein [Candidatus Latescibacterota bacterium]
MRALLLFLALTIELQAQEYPGYRLEPAQVVVEGAKMWRAWEAPEGVRIIEADGNMRPFFLRRDVNACLNAADFISMADGDTVIGGIGARGVPADTLSSLIIDGDPNTSWEPDLGAGLNKAWVEINLGRVVVARRIVLRFAATGQGDPFLKFRVLASDGSYQFGQQGRREFVRAGQVVRPNKDQREFVFELEPQRPMPEGVVGEMVQFVRVELLDSDTTRAEEVSLDQYQHLAAADQGAIDYFRATATGRQIPVIQESYQQLPPQERGPVRRFRREHPRLAEVEVYALGDEVVAMTQKAHLEEGNFIDDLARRLLTDGLHSTVFGLRIYDPFRNQDQVSLDLGARFWLERVRLLSPHSPPTSYQIRISDGSLDAGGQLLWESFDERLNRESFLQLEERFPPREVRYIEVRRLDLLQSGTNGNLSEIQAYGEGYVSDLTANSPLMRLGQRRMVTRLHWEGEVPPDARLELRTRSGDELIQISHYFNRYGGETSEALYERLSESQRGPIQIEEQPGPDWSTWSELYQTSGEGFRSPSPRRLVQVQVRLRSGEPLRFASIRKLRLEFAPPLVDQLLGEIWPATGVAAGEDQEFRLLLRPVILPSDPGFDLLRLSSSSSAPIELLGLRAGTDSQLRVDQAQLLWPGPVHATSENGEVELLFPETWKAPDQILELSFRTRLFLPSTIVRVQVGAQGTAGVAQEAAPGEASSLVDSRSLVVVGELGRQSLVGKGRVAPAIFTPNGDGINDQAVLQVPIFQVEGQRRLRVEVFDLAGRRLRDLSTAPGQLSGEHHLPWDGKDEQGRLLPPGIYLFHLELDTDAKASGTRFTWPVHLVY